jgi:uncharacterized protein with HEPN domain
MSRRDDSAALRHMLEHAEEAVAMAGGRRRDDLDADRTFYLAILKLVEIVGEAATRVSDAAQQSRPEIPWRQIIGTRNHLIHGYDAVDRDILWTILADDFPAILPHLRRLVADGA